MKVSRVWEKPWFSKSERKRYPGRWRYFVDGFAPDGYRTSGAGHSLAEAKRDLRHGFDPSACTCLPRTPRHRGPFWKPSWMPDDD